MDKQLTANNYTIAFYIGSLCIGGAERVITNLANFFNSNGYTVYMVTKLRDEEEYELDDGIVRIIADIQGDEITGSRVRNLYRRIYKLQDIWKRIHPDIIVSFIRKNNLMALASAKPLGIPVVASVRSAPERELAGAVIGRLSRFMFRWASGIVVQTSRGKEYFDTKLQKKVAILPNSINPAFLDAGSKGKDIGRKSSKQIISVGRIDDNKNQKMLIEAFMRLAGKYPDWSLHLYGDGERKEQLEKYVQYNNLADRVIFHGRVDDVQRRLQMAEIFVLPSKVEGMPNALIEAMVMGLACVSTDCPCGGPADLIISGENGYLIAVDDTEALANRLDELMSNEDELIRIGNNARDIINRLHPDIVNNQWKDYIEGIVNENAS